MNVLQSFMGCMYPGSIKTESIESLDHDPNCTFQVSNIDEKAKEVSRGEIHLTDKDVFYFRPGKFPIQWPIGCIRRYGCNDTGDIFTVETGRQSSTGEAIYAFQLANAQDLVNRLRERIEKNAKVSSDESQSANNNRSSFKLNRNCFNSRADQVDINKFSNQNQRQRSLNDLPRKISHNEIDVNFSESQQNTSNYTDIQNLDIKLPPCLTTVNEEIDLKPMPYSNINTDVTQSLNEVAKAHAANRQR